MRVVVDCNECGCSSVDRVLASEAKGRGFDPRQPHQTQRSNVTPLMPSHARSSRSTALNTVTVGPLTMARAVASTLFTCTRATIQTARQIAAMVQSVEVLDDTVHVSAAPEVVPPSGGPLVCVPVGNENVALRTDMSVDRTERSVTLTFKLDAYLLDPQSVTRFGPLVSRLTGRINTQVRINLRDTLEAERVAPPTAPRKLLSRPLQK